MTSDAIKALPYRACVGVVLVNREGRLFAGQRIDNPGDAWQMPQGGIDPGEEPIEAALRELGEETGVPPEAVAVEAETAGWVTYDLPDALIPKLWGGKFRGQKQRWFLMRLTGSEGLIDITRDKPEFSAWAWMEPDELVDKIVPFKRAVYRAVLAELGIH